MSGVRTEDWVAISDLMGRYCWLVDEGRAEEWADLWTADGTFTGIAPEPVVGTAALRGIPTAAFADYGGAMRHMFGNLSCRYGGDDNSILATLYNHVSVWGRGAESANFVMALCEVTFVREGADWRIKRNDARLLVP